MFLSTKKELGTLKAGSKVNVEFPYKDIKVITRMESPCDCSLPSDIRTQSKVVIEYTPKGIPEHLRLEGRTSYNTEKHIQVTYLNLEGKERMETLVFTATIHK